MANISVDLTNVEGGDFELLPEGTYNATVYEVEFNEEKNYLNWEFRITDADYEDRRAWTITSLKPNALWKLKQILNRIAPEMDLSGQLNIDTDELGGLPCRLDIIHEEYKGDTKARVDEVHAPQEGASGGNDTDLPV